MVHAALQPGSDASLGVPRVREIAWEDWTATLSRATLAQSFLEEGGHRFDMAILPPGRAP